MGGRRNGVEIHKPERMEVNRPWMGKLSLQKTHSVDSNARSECSTETARLSLRYLVHLLELFTLYRCFEILW